MEELNSNLISLIIATCALILTLYQIYSNRKHNYLGVRPYIKFRWTAGETGDGVCIKNVGLGPAIIDDFIIIYQDKKISSKYLSDYLVDAGFPSSMVVATKGATIQEKDTHWLIKCKDGIIADGVKQGEFWNLISGTKFIIEYRSFYNKKQPKIEWTCPNPIKEFVSQKPHSV